MVCAAEDENVRASRESDGRAQSHHVCFRAGIGEANQFHGGSEAFAHELGQLFLVDIVAAEIPAVTQGVGDGGVDDGMVVPVDSRRVFAEEIRVAVAVQAGQAAGRS